MQSIDYSVEELIGVGYGIGKTIGDIPILRFDVIPIICAVQPQRNISALDGSTLTVGVMEDFVKQVIKRWSINQSFAYLRNTNVGDDYRLSFNIVLNTRLFGPMSGQVTYTMLHQNIVAAGAQSTDHRVAGGLALKRP